ncbi:hypothetical protein MHLP_04080 [Candidatus Mycoplasma haematolamae str. Purdue]|uniref:Uncharacterized protein n=1 Tax=Mycoplasma haematolamae (strain Purdue) TaxID=1212765 RepID=I7CGK5_MYCHA|nr:hypothetical protein [Candidatus Mycoplasma haematolamae]AFO52396.1 hypothetical protein MHLP_04080 [Candidatus Mycoplasma haematolamae str. Purdue]
MIIGPFQNLQDKGVYSYVNSSSADLLEKNKYLQELEQTEDVKAVLSYYPYLKEYIQQRVKHLIETRQYPDRQIYT